MIEILKKQSPVHSSAPVRIVEIVALTTDRPIPDFIFLIFLKIMILSVFASRVADVQYVIRRAWQWLYFYFFASEAGYLCIRQRGVMRNLGQCWLINVLVVSISGRPFATASVDKPSSSSSCWWLWFLMMIMVMMMVMTVTLLQDPAGLLDDCPKLTNLHQNGDNVDVE